MKNKTFFTEILVVATLLGYIAASITVFFHANTSYGEPFKNDALFTVLQGLTAMIGGFVAFAFGVSNKTTTNKLGVKLMSVGSFTTKSNKQNKHKLYGSIFVFLYILFGFIAIVIWVVFDDKTLSSVKDMATTFLALLLPIVSAYLYNREE